MTPSCRRPGCGLSANVVITFDPVGCQVWLDPLDSPSGVGGQPLCAMHVERLNTPRGWVVLDRRAPQSVLRMAQAATTATSPPATSRRPLAPKRRWGEFAEPKLEFEEPVSVSVPPSPPIEPPVVEPPVVEPPSPPIEPPVVESPPIAPPPIAPPPIAPPAPIAPPPVPTDDLGALLEPSGGLLGRAFASTGHQKSVLTHVPAPAPSGDDEPVALPDSPEPSDRSDSWDRSDSSD